MVQIQCMQQQIKVCMNDEMLENCTISLLNTHLCSFKCDDQTGSTFIMDYSEVSDITAPVRGYM